MNRLREKCFLAGRLTPAAKADAENKPVIAVLKHCATQIKSEVEFFPQPVKSCPSQTQRESEFFRSLRRRALPNTITEIGSTHSRLASRDSQAPH
jgi:hypothetical protein